MRPKVSFFDLRTIQKHPYNEQLAQDKDCFPDDESCLQFLAEYKWKDGFICRKCGHENYCKGKKPFSRRCTRCKTEESATAHTVFHRCKIPLADAFGLARLICSQPDISSYEMSRIYKKRQMTCWNFKNRIIACLNNPEKLVALHSLMEAKKPGF